MRLYLLECKKIMTSRFHLILLLLFMMLPMVIFQNRITDTGEIRILIGMRMEAG